MLPENNLHMSGSASDAHDDAPRPLEFFSPSCDDVCSAHELFSMLIVKCAATVPESARAVIAAGCVAVDLLTNHCSSPPAEVLAILTELGLSPLVSPSPLPPPPPSSPTPPPPQPGARVVSEGGGEGLGAGEVGSAEEANLYDDENDAAMDNGLATAEKGLPSSIDGLPFTQTQKQSSEPTVAKEARETSPAGDTDTVSPPTSTLSLWKGHLGSLLASIVACLIEAGRLEASTSFWIWDSSQVDTLLSTLQLERPELFSPYSPSQLPPFLSLTLTLPTRTEQSLSALSTPTTWPKLLWEMTGCSTFFLEVRRQPSLALPMGSRQVSLLTFAQPRLSL